MFRFTKSLVLVSISLLTGGCLAGHTAEVKSRPLPPLPDPINRHANRLYVQLPEEATRDSQCVAYEGYQTLCFVRVRRALEQALTGLLWPSFPEVRVRRHGDELREGDYLLQVELALDALPPDQSRHGWSAAARGRWRVVRDGLPLEGETLSTRSRGDFAYGSGLGEAAAEVVEAAAAHIAQVMVRLPESKPPRPVRLPPVVAKRDAAPAGFEAAPDQGHSGQPEQESSKRESSAQQPTASGSKAKSKP